MQNGLDIILFILPTLPIPTMPIDFDLASMNTFEEEKCRMVLTFPRDLARSPPRNRKAILVKVKVLKGIQLKGQGIDPIISSSMEIYFGIYFPVSKLLMFNAWATTDWVSNNRTNK